MVAVLSRKETRKFTVNCEVMLEPCCCDIFTRTTYCKHTGKTCLAFRKYIVSGRWLDKHMGVDFKG